MAKLRINGAAVEVPAAKGGTTLLWYLRDELGLVVEQRIRAEAEARMAGADRARIEAEVVDHRLDPWSAADRLLGPG